MILGTTADTKQTPVCGTKFNGHQSDPATRYKTCKKCGADLTASAGGKIWGVGEKGVK